jgi:hypothetical protein
MLQLVHLVKSHDKASHSLHHLVTLLLLAHSHARSHDWSLVQQSGRDDEMMLQLVHLVKSHDKASHSLHHLVTLLLLALANGSVEHSGRKEPE